MKLREGSLTALASLPCHRKVGGVRRQDGAAVLADVLGTSQSAARGPVGGHMLRRPSSLEPFDSAAEWWTATSAANRLIGEVVQSRRRPLLGPSPG